MRTLQLPPLYPQLESLARSDSGDRDLAMTSPFNAVPPLVEEQLNENNDEEPMILSQNSILIDLQE